MKFLIFNAIVFCSLGYLLTSSPNQNFNQWFVDKKDKMVNLSKEDYIKKMKSAVSKNNHDKEVENKFNSLSSSKTKKDHAEKIQNAIKSAKNNKDLKIKNKKLEDELLEIKEELSKIKRKKEQNNFSQLEDSQKNTNNNKKAIPKKPLQNNQDVKREIQELANKFNQKNVLADEKTKNFEKNNFLSPEERSQALAELITDLQLYSIKGIIN
tara:strand:- start:103 stop:735 length:633 start_codon:yes stop_codon:yes gene_type:complete